LHVAKKTVYDSSLGSSNYNIWHLKKDALSENDNLVNLPSVVCSFCLAEHYVIYFPTTTCKICHDVIPTNLSHSPFDNVHSVVDTNYIQWPICNTCANEHWHTTLVCICGKKCHEADMIQLNSSKMSQFVNKNANITCWHILNVIAPVENNENIILTVNKVCKDCATTSGSTTPKGKQAFDNLIYEDCWDFDNHPLSHFNIVHLENVQSSEIKIYPNPSIVSYIKNQNSAKIGYAIQYSQAF
jgi:hypothetical protein